MKDENKKNLLNNLVDTTTKHPLKVLLIVLFITLLALIPASKLSVDTDLESFINPDDPIIKNYTDITDEFGEQELVTVVVDCSNSNQSNAKNYVESLASKLSKDSRFRDIQYKQDMSFVGEKAFLYLTDDNLTFVEVQSHELFRKPERLYF